jgi:hypothetical protein
MEAGNMVELIRSLHEKGIKRQVVMVLHEPLRDDQDEPAAEAVAQARIALLLLDTEELPRIEYENGSVQSVDQQFLRTRVLVSNHITSSRRFRRLRFAK